MKSLLYRTCLPYPQILHRNVDFVDKQGLGEKAGGSLTIKCKDLKVIRVDIMNNEEFASVVDSIEKLSAIGEGTNIRAIKKFYYKNVMLDLQSLVLPK